MIRRSSGTSTRTSLNKPNGTTYFLYIYNHSSVLSNINTILNAQFLPKFNHREQWQILQFHFNIQQILHSISSCTTVLENKCTKKLIRRKNLYPNKTL